MGVDDTLRYPNLPTSERDDARVGPNARVAKRNTLEKMYAVPPRRGCWQHRPTAEDDVIGTSPVSASFPARHHHRPRIDRRTRARPALLPVLPTRRLGQHTRSSCDAGVSKEFGNLPSGCAGRILVGIHRPRRPVLGTCALLPQQLGQTDDGRGDLAGRWIPSAIVWPSTSP